jgi:hypothetical protein
VDRDKLKHALQALEAVKNLLRSPGLSLTTFRQLENLKRTLELEISAMTSEPHGDGKDDGGVAAD